MMEITNKMSDASPEELELLLEQMGEIQEQLDIGNFYMLDVKVEEMANGLGLSVIGLDRDVATLSGDSVPKYCSRSFF